MKQYIDKSAVVAEIERIKKEECPTDSYEGRCKLLWFERFLSFIETLEVKEVEEEPVSNDLEEAVNAYIGHAPEVDECSSVYGERQAFKAGAQWQKEQMITKACNYLFSHMGLFVTFFDDDIVEDIERSEFIKKFRIAMEDKT